jgi:putative transposase
MLLRYRYRAEPTRAQRQQLAKTFGCARVVFNEGLRLREDARAAGLPYVPDGEVQRRVVTAAKGTPERAWLAEVSSVALVQACNDLHRAYGNFFAGLAGERRGRRPGPPRFRTKRGPQAVRLTRNGFGVTPRGVRLAKIGDVRLRWSRPLPAVPSSCSVLLDAAGRCFVSFVVDVPAAPLPPTAREVGIDLGLARFATLDSGEVIANPRPLRQRERRLKAAQHALSRKRKGSANREQARRRVARLHARVKDARHDFLHQLSTRLLRENQAVYVEDLAVQGLARTRRRGLAKSVHDAAWGTFLRLLEEKAQRYGRTVVKVPRFAPTSQACSGCGLVDGPKPLGVRGWTCGGCGAVHDRDVNAALNILALGRRDRRNASGARRSPTLGLAAGAEGGTSDG